MPLCVASSQAKDRVGLLYIPSRTLLALPSLTRAIAYMQGATTAVEHDAWHFPNARLHARPVAGAVAPAVAPQVAPAAE